MSLNAPPTQNSRFSVYHRTSWPFDDIDSATRFNDLVHKLTSSRDGGVAVFGAGASVPAGFPTWHRFHEKFLEHFQAEPASPIADPVISMLTDIDYHTSRDHDRSLGFIKSTFARHVDSVTPVVKSAQMAQSLKYYYTTNFDEILSLISDGEEIASYPDFEPLTARFVYLHGRASTAESVDKHLVIGRTGYELAYSDSYGAPVANKLQPLANYPLVFIGLSMADRWMAWSLEKIALAARYRQRRLHGLDISQVSQLDWYILDKAPLRDDTRRDQYKRSREELLAQFGITVIWYQDGGEGDPHRGVLEISQQIVRRSRELTVAEQSSGFVERLIEAEELAAVVMPTAHQVELAAGIVSGDPRIAATFLDRVDGVAWFEGLRDAGVLDPSPVIISHRGSQIAPRWHAWAFLRRLSAIAPNFIADFLSSIDTDNWMAIRAALDILETLEDDAGSRAALHLGKLSVRSLSVDTLLLYSIASTAVQLEAGGRSRTAAALVGATLLELAENESALSEGTAADFSNSVSTIVARSSDLFSTLRLALRSALNRRYEAPEEDRMSLTRPAIEHHRSNLIERSVVGLFIDVTRDALLEMVASEARESVVADLLQSEWPTERRVGIAHCFLNRSDLATHEATIITPENLTAQQLFHEMAKLISDCYSDLSSASIQVIRDFVMSLHEGTSELNKYEYALWAQVIPPHLLPVPPMDTERDDEYLDSRLFRGTFFSGVFSPGAPLDKQGFAECAAELSPGQLLDLVRNPEDRGIRVTWRHDASEMWTLLAEYAEDHSSLDPLLEITLGDLSNSQVWRAIEAMPDVAGSEMDKWESILDWTSHMASLAESHRLWPIGRLLVRIGELIPLPLVERLCEIAIQVIERTRRSAVEESEYAKDTLLGGFLNLPAGSAVQSLFEVLRRGFIEVDTSEVGEADIPVWFSTTVLMRLERDPIDLGIDAWIGLGRHFALLCERSPEAVAFVTRRMGMESPEHSAIAEAFWAGYLWAPFVSTDALIQLREAYWKSAAVIQRDGMLEDDLRDRFFQHIVIGTLREVRGFEEMILSTLSNRFAPTVRGAVASALGRAVREAADQPESSASKAAVTWLCMYWREHVDRVGGADGVYLAVYLRYLNDIRVSPADIERLIEASLGQADDSFDVRSIFLYLSNYIEDEPRLVLRLLRICVDWYLLHGDFWLDSGEVCDLLDRLVPIATGDPAFGDLVSGFAEIGLLSGDDLRRYLGQGLE